MEQYLRFFVDHRQKNWSEWLVIAEFMVKNKFYIITEISLFIANYERELQMRLDKKGKVEKAIEFVKRIRKE